MYKLILTSYSNKRLVKCKCCYERIMGSVHSVPCKERSVNKEGKQGRDSVFQAENADFQLPPQLCDLRDRQQRLAPLQCQ